MTVNLAVLMTFVAEESKSLDADFVTVMSRGLPFASIENSMPTVPSFLWRRSDDGNIVRVIFNFISGMGGAATSAWTPALVVTNIAAAMNPHTR